MSQTIYFGTYTKKESKGIYKAQFDPETGTLNQLELVAAEPNPTYIAFSEKHIVCIYSICTESVSINLTI